MHSILESEGVPSDPYEVVCHMGALIIEGRTPLHISKVTGEMTACGDTPAKTGKPYSEGPHCPTFTKLYSKDSHVHKCSEKNVLCIRHSNLKQHLLHLHGKCVPIVIEVSLGPDCLCGELRSQSTLVSPSPSKRDVVLEQWVITVTNKRCHEPSQMSVMNLYQALRSLLHFSQLTAWYMNNNGMKPAHVIYRIGIPGDSIFISDENFIKHDFPVADINKTTSIKISVKTLPRMERIPTVSCPLHPVASAEETQGAHGEVKEKMYLSTEPLKVEEEKEKLPLKFQGVRKKIFEVQERKRKKRISLYGSSSTYDNGEVDFLDGMPVEAKKLEPQKVVGVYEYFSNKKLFQSDAIGESSLMKTHMDVTHNYNRALDLMIQNLCDRSKSDFRTKEKSEGYSNLMHILDDRMQISCAISGKHHCKSECEEDVERVSNEKPKRRRSLSKVRKDEGATCHGKYKLTEVETGHKLAAKCRFLALEPPENSKLLSTLPEAKQTPITDSLPLEESSSELESFSESESSRSEGEEVEVENIIQETLKKKADEVKCATFEKEHISETSNPFLEAILRTTKRSENNCDNKLGISKAINNDNNNGCYNYNSDSRDEDPVIDVVDDDDNNNHKNDSSGNNCNENNNNNNNNHNNNNNNNNNNRFSGTSGSSNSCSSNGSSSNNCCVGSSKEAEKTNDICDPLDTNLGKGDIFFQKLRNPITCYLTEKVSDLKAKVEISEKVQSFKNDESGAFREQKKSRKTRLDLKLGIKSSAVKDLSDIGDDTSILGPSEFLAKSFSRLKCLFDKGDARIEKRQQHKEKFLTSEVSSEGSICNNNNSKVIPVPSAQDKLKFRRSLDSAAQLVFHRCSGLPLTSSPAPVRRNNNSFSFDSSLNSVSAIKSALFEASNSVSSEDENESEGSLRSPASPGAWSTVSKPYNYHSLSPLPLLGTFEESVLNGRLEPVSTVHGFTAELGASGSFCPRHMHLPVTVFFYTLGDNDKVSAPYMGHINLGKKGYNVPKSGTIQVTLFNPLRTVVKMFVVVYDLHDMPLNSHTFLRQRTLYMPANQKEAIYVDKRDSPFEQEDYHKYLRYLIHLRFVSGKTGKIYLHTDIRMIIFRKADVDTATAFGNQYEGEAFELRSHTHGPINPKFSPRK